MNEPRGQELIDRYKRNYYMSSGVDISESMILQHWQLEKDLAQTLRTSTPENRWETFDRSYTRLYLELPWLNESAGTPDDAELARRFEIWKCLIGDPPQDVFEIGSGKGELIEFLASSHYPCRATEITRERGVNRSMGKENLTWQITDGIHLDQFERNDSYDVAISNQVIKHMHPDDLLEHFAGVRTILKGGGRYIFKTPHNYFGPSDVSRVFNCKTSLGMHLREYTYRELVPLLREAGFETVSAVWRIPPKAAARLGRTIRPRASTAYLGYLRAVELMLAVVPATARRKIASILRLAFFPTDIFVVARKKM